MKDFTQATRNFLFQEAFMGAHEGMIITDGNARIQVCNEAFCRISGYEEAELLGQNPSILSSGKQGRDFYRAMWDCLQEQGRWQGEVWNRRKDGAFYAELLSIKRLSLSDSTDTYYLGMMTDITATKAQQSTLEKLAHYDALTGLPNRNLLHDRFEQAVAASNRMHEMMAVCFIDLDDFKPVNDRYGHLVGDYLLMQLARRIEDNIKVSDTVCRYGGDEFVILLTALSSRADCEQALAALLEVITTPFMIEGHCVEIGASIGYTLYPFDRGSLETLISHADHTLYQVKKAGKNGICMFGSVLPEGGSYSTAFTPAEVLEALQRHELRLYFQPQIDLSSNKVVGVESMLRWQHPNKGLLSPLEFLPAINRTEVEICLGQWVIREALSRLQQWQQQGLALRVSVNLSAYHLEAAGFVDSVRRICADFTGVDFSYFEIEILESHAIDNVAIIKNVIEACYEEFGIAAALDDFGTGYSSLSHVRVLPVRKIKIDQSFVCNMLNDIDDYKIVEGVVALASSFDIEVVAEGVESSRHAEVLLCMGCHQVQGYAVARPMAAEAVRDWLGTFIAPHSDGFVSASEASPVVMQLKLLRLFLDLEYEHAEHYYQTGLYRDHNWSVNQSRKNHCDYWLKQAARSLVIGKSLHYLLQKRYSQFVSDVYNLMTLYKCGELEPTDAAFHAVAQSYAALCELVRKELEQQQYQCLTSNAQ